MHKVSLFASLLIVVAGICPAQSPFNIKLTVSGQTACTNSPALTMGTSANLVVNNNGASGQGAGAGTLNLSDVTLTKLVDSCSVALYRLLFTGAHIPTVTISAFNGTVEALRITLTGALVTGMSDTAASNAPTSEKVTLDFDRIEILDVVSNTSVGYDTNTRRVLP